jgi:hypothetical protein
MQVVSPNTTKVEWELSLQGTRTYPLRMAFVLLAMPAIVWVSFYVVFPAVVLAFVPVIGRVVYGDIRPALTVFVLVCGCLVAATVLMARNYARMGYEIDSKTNTLRIVPPDELRSDIQKDSVVSPEDLQTDLAEITRIEFFTLPGYTVARMRYPGLLPENPYAFIVPSYRYSEIESVLQTAGVSVSSDVGLTAFEQLRTRWQRFAVLVVSIGVTVVAPVAALIAITLTP